MSQELVNGLGAGMTRFANSIKPGADLDREYRDTLVALAATVEMYADTLRLAYDTLVAAESTYRASQIQQIIDRSNDVEEAREARAKEMFA